MLAGTRLAKLFDGAGAWMIEGRAAWAHELERFPDLSLRFAGDAATGGFALAAPSVRPNSAVFAVSLGTRALRGFRVSTNLDAEVGGPMSGWGGTVAVNKDW